MIGSIATRSGLERGRLVDSRYAFSRRVLGAAQWTSEPAPLVWGDRGSINLRLLHVAGYNGTRLASAELAT